MRVSPILVIGIGLEKNLRKGEKCQNLRERGVVKRGYADGHHNGNLPQALNDAGLGRVLHFVPINQHATPIQSMHGILGVI